MSLQTRVTDLAIRIGQEFNQLRAEVANTFALLNTNGVINVSGVTGTTATAALDRLKTLLYEESGRRITPLLHQTANNFSTYLEVTFNPPEDGDYNLDWDYIYSLNNNANDFRSRMVVDIGTPNEQIIDPPLRIEPKDSAGGSTSIPNTTGGNTNNGTDQRYPAAEGYLLEGFSAGAHTFTLQFCASLANLEPVIYRGRIKLKRTNIT